MDLSSELISQFAKITNDNKKEKTESTVYGTTVELDGRIYVKLDGSDRLTPVETTTAVAGDERVMVTIKDHSATITGNISSPAAKDNEVKELGNKIDEFDTIVADKVKAETAEIETAIITKLDATYASIKSLESAEADIDELQADNVEINKKLTARDAEINQLKANSLTVEVADAKYATIDDLEATTGEFNSLKSTYGEFVDLTTDKFEAIEGTIADLDVESLNAKYANIDFSNIGKAAMENFYANSGLIENVVVGDQTITGELVGVTIRGDRIIGGSIVADKLVIKGDDGIYYKLNAEGGATADQLATEEFKNGLHGSNIIANSITAEKIKVDDLVAFDATIGNFNIGDNSIYSGAKSSVSNATRGIYMDTDGQLNFGDSNNYLKYYKDQNGNYKLDISASSITMSTSGKNVEEAINGLAVTGSASGSVITLNDSSDGGLIDLKIYGKTTQDGTPTPDNPIELKSVGDSGSYEVGVYGRNILKFNATPTTETKNGITFTINDDNTVTANGTATANALTTIFSGTTNALNIKKGVTYSISDETPSPSSNTYYTYMNLIPVNSAEKTVLSTHNPNLRSFTCEDDIKRLYMQIVIKSGVTVSNLVFKPMICVGETSLPYEPYNKQTLTLTDTLRGIGDIADEKDFARGVKTHRYNKSVFNGSEAWALNTSGTNTQRFTLALSEAKNIGNGACTHFNWITSGFSNDTEFIGVYEGNLFLRVSKTIASTVAELKSWLASNNITIIYELATPIETPLTEQELNAYRQLHTNKPNTTLIADGSPNMYVEYFKNTEDGKKLAKNADALKLSVDNAQSAIQVLDNKITSNVTETNSLKTKMSTVEQTASGLSSRVTSTENSISNLRVSDRNLILDSGILKSSTNYLIATYTLSEDWVVGETYTLIIKGKHSGSYFGFWRDGGSRGISGAHISTYADNNYTASVTFVCPEPWDDTLPKNLISVYDVPSTATHNSFISWIKLVKGNVKLSDWTAAPEDARIGGRNLLTNSNFAKVRKDDGTGLGTGIRAEGYSGYNGGIADAANNYHACIDQNTFGVNVYAFNESNGLRLWKGTSYSISGLNPDAFKEIKTSKDEYCLSMDVYQTIAGGKIFGGFYYTKTGATSPGFYSGQYTIPSESISVGYWKRVSVKVPYNHDMTDTSTLSFYFYGYGFSSNTIVYMKNVKLEKGNKATDWTPAPEDIDSDIAAVQGGVDNNAQKIVEAETNIEQLSTQISTLVRDGSGKSLMTQTSTGWTFSMGDFEAALNNLLAHVKIGTYNGQPCLELVVDDTKQKLMLTNTEIRFMESDTTAAYVSGNTMNIDHAQIDNGLSIGSGYNWAEDSDDILNLIYQ